MQGLLIIILLQLVYVPLLTLRTILVVKGNIKYATPIGFAEAFVNIVGISIILTGENNILKILVYCAGYALGIFLGSKIEQRLAIGFQSANIIIEDINSKLIETLREEGFGVTVQAVVGRNGEKIRLDVITRRTDIRKLKRITTTFEPSAFISIFEIADYKGGHIIKHMREKRPSKRSN